MLREQLLALLRCRFVGEETGVLDHPDARFCWVVDPHDGTSAFLQGHRGSAISVALLQDAMPVLGVVFAPLSPDRGPDLIAWITGMDHLLLNGDPIRVDLNAHPLAPGDMVFLNHEAALRPIANGLRPARADRRCSAAKQPTDDSELNRWAGRRPSEPSRRRSSISVQS